MTIMPQKVLGSTKLSVSAIGLGCMGMSEFYGQPPREDDSLELIEKAVESGITLLDTADMYGMGSNERLLAKFLKRQRGNVVIATKFGMVRSDDPEARSVNGTPQYVQAACEASLERLGIETIDLYYLHRVDPNVPIEETVGAMARLVEQGKVRHIGLSEAGEQTIRRAHAVYPITAVQTEYSLWSRDAEKEIVPTLEELGIGLVAYSPLGRGFLSGTIRRYEDLGQDDVRRTHPRFQGSNFDLNLRLVDEVQRLATSRGVKASQLALAWVMAQSKQVVPIPGTTSIGHLLDNIAAAEIELSADEIAHLSSILTPEAVAGERYGTVGMTLLNR